MTPRPPAPHARAPHPLAPRRAPRAARAARAAAALALLAALTTTGASPAPTGGEAPPEVSAAAWVVADAGTGDVLAAQDPHEPLPPASTLKLLTALALMGSLDPTAEQVASEADARAVGSKVGLVPGASYTVDQLWQAVFLQSGNDAASALAAAYGGEQRTVRAMQEEAERLGADDTRVAGPTGLDEHGQVSTAYDLAAIGRAALGVPGIVQHATTLRADFPGAMPAPGERRMTYEIGTQQDFVRSYEGALGLKNGHTTLGRGTLVAAAERDGRTLVVTLLRSTGDPAGEAAELMDWGFANAAAVEPVAQLPEPRAQGAGSAALDGAAGEQEPGAAALVASTSAVPADGPSLLERAAGVLVRVLAVLLVVVAGLRARVLLRRRRRRLRRLERAAQRRPGSRGRSRPRSPASSRAGSPRRGAPAPRRSPGPVPVPAAASAPASAPASTSASGTTTRGSEDAVTASTWVTWASTERSVATHDAASMSARAE
ncbi:D-alanyl-D-alanine carboxypeptidase family protein [Vallicoccus soli]|nr:serine hydrolase [Vallicoccus soli]